VASYSPGVPLHVLVRVGLVVIEWSYSVGPESDTHEIRHCCVRTFQAQVRGRRSGGILFAGRRGVCPVPDPTAKQILCSITLWRVLSLAYILIRPNAYVRSNFTLVATGISFPRRRWYG
jgi:hypothetical protein